MNLFTALSYKIPGADMTINVIESSVKDEPKKKPAVKVLAWLINCPGETYDREVWVSLDNEVPREAVITKRIGPSTIIQPIIAYLPSEDTLQVATGTFSTHRFGHSKEIPSGMRFTTPAWFYKTSSREAPKSSKFYESPKAFINAIAEGVQWDTPEAMGPYQFGAVLSLQPLRRQLTKVQRIKAVELLKKNLKLVGLTLIGASIFVFIIQTQ